MLLLWRCEIVAQGRSPLLLGSPARDADGTSSLLLGRARVSVVHNVLDVARWRLLLNMTSILVRIVKRRNHRLLLETVFRTKRLVELIITATFLRVFAPILIRCHAQSVGQDWCVLSADQHVIFIDYHEFIVVDLYLVGVALIRMQRERIIHHLELLVAHLHMRRWIPGHLLLWGLYGGWWLLDLP